MWFQSPPPTSTRWVLHVAATSGQLADVLRDLCIDERPRDIGDDRFPVYLCGTGGPYGRSSG